MPRRESRGEDFDFAPKVLSPKQKAALRLKFDGWTGAQILDATGYSQAWVSVLSNSDAGLAYIEELEKLTQQKLAEVEAASVVSPARLEVRERIDREAGTSLQRLLNIRDGSDDVNVVARISQDLLDRAGLKEPEKVEVSEKVLASPSLIAALDLIRKRAAKSAS